MQGGSLEPSIIGEDEEWAWEPTLVDCEKVWKECEDRDPGLPVVEGGTSPTTRPGLGSKRGSSKRLEQLKSFAKNSRSKLASSAKFQTSPTHGLMLGTPNRRDKERRRMIKEVRKRARGEKMSVPAEAGLVLSLLWSGLGIHAADVLPMVAYAGEGVRVKDLRSVVEGVLGPNPSDKVGFKQFGELIMRFADAGLHVRWDDKYTKADGLFAYVTGCVTIRARHRLRRRVQALAAVFVAVDADQKGRVSLVELQHGMVSVGEYFSLKQLTDALLDLGEISLDNLDAVDFPTFLKLIGYLDGKTPDQRTALGTVSREHPMGTQHAADHGAVAVLKPGSKHSAQLGVKTLNQLTRLFIELDDDSTGIISCAALPERIVRCARLPGTDADLLFRLACELANTYLRETDTFDFEELVQEATQLLIKPGRRVAKGRRRVKGASLFVRPRKLGVARDWIELYRRDGSLRPPGSNIPWTSLLDKLPLSNRARLSDFETALDSLSARQLCRTTRDGSTIFHHVAYHGDPVAAKLLVHRSKLLAQLPDRNRAGVHAAALAVVRQHFECAAVLRPWIQYVQESQLVVQRATKLQIRNAAISNAAISSAAHSNTV